jgi:cyclase
LNIRTKRWAIVGTALLGVASVAGISAAEQVKIVDSADGNIEVVPIRGNIYLIAGAGSNIVLSIGEDGTLMVDTGAAENADKVLAAVQHLGMDLASFKQPITKNLGAGGSGSVLSSTRPPKPIRFVLNTSALPDHTGGNVKIAVAGKTFTGGNVAGDLADVGEGAAVLSHENVLKRLSDAKMPYKGLPTQTYFGGAMKLSHFFNNEPVVMYHFPNAIQDGDSIVHFRTEDVLVAGDIFTFASYPPINIAEGGSVQGVLAGLNRMLEIIVPEYRSEGGTFVVPGHGRIADAADVAYYRDMVTIIRDRVQDGIAKGKSLQEIQAMRPTEDWDGRFGATERMTPNKFVEAVYQSLKNPPAQKK